MNEENETDVVEMVPEKHKNWVLKLEKVCQNAGQQIPRVSVVCSLYKLLHIVLTSLSIS